MNTYCDVALNNIFYVIKNIMNLIMILSPILLIISLSVLFIKMTFSPDDKKLIHNLMNAVKALIIIFIIPSLITLVMNLVGNRTDITKCYLNSSSFNASTEYIDDGDESNPSRKPILNDSDDYEPGNPKKLDFSCTSKKVKAQFSCETLKIVENHLYDLNYYNFRSVIASYGGFDNYAKSLGGVFGEYYGKTLNVKTELEFQKVAEYTFGWMYMYGMDYYSGSVYQNWGVGLGQSGHSDDAFYPGNIRASHPSHYFDQNFDEIISGTGVNQDLAMATECGPAATAPLYKAGILKKGQKRGTRVFVNSFKDLRPGDYMYFFHSRVDRSTDRDTWGPSAHVVLVGEVYDDKIVLYDGGSYFQVNRNYKRKMKMVYTKAEEYAEVKKEFGFDEWVAERLGHLEK